MHINPMHHTKMKTQRKTSENGLTICTMSKNIMCSNVQTSLFHFWKESLKFLRVVLSKVGLFHYLVDTILNLEFLKNMFATKIKKVLTQYNFGVCSHVWRWRQVQDDGACKPWLWNWYLIVIFWATDLYFKLQIRHYVAITGIIDWWGSWKWF